MKNYKFILALLLIGITIFSVFKYTLSLKERYDLLNSLKSLKEQMATLETEKQNLSGALEKEKELQKELTQEISNLKGNLKASHAKLTKLFADFEEAQKIIEKLGSQNSLLEAENTALREEKNNLELEKENLKARLSSLTELKKAIKELKRQMRKVGTEIKEKTKTEETPEGNRGFLIKDGKSTYSLLKIKIEVTPLPTKE